MALDVDWRLDNSCRRRRFSPKLAEAFAMVAGNTQSASRVTINERQLPVKQLATGAIWFDFSDICAGPRSQMDYLHIAREYHTVAVSQHPAA